MEELQINFYRIIYTAILFLIVLIVRYGLNRVIRNTTLKWERLQTRTKLVKKTLDYVYMLIILVLLFMIWGIKLDDIGLFLSSVFAVIGIALFAQWSILSNITSGVIMFFTFPYKIGDFIKIYDGDNSILGYIEDIRSFQVIIKTIDGRKVAFPNSLMLLKGVAILEKEHIDALKVEANKRKEASEK